MAYIKFYLFLGFLACSLVFSLHTLRFVLPPIRHIIYYYFTSVQICLLDFSEMLCWYFSFCSHYLRLISERNKRLESYLLQLFLGTLSAQFDFKHLEEVSFSLQDLTWFSSDSSALSLISHLSHLNSRDGEYLQNLSFTKVGGYFG